MIIHGCLSQQGTARGIVKKTQREREYGHNIQDISSEDKENRGERRLLSASQTDPPLSNERVPSAPNVRTISAAHLARALIPFLLREAELFQNHLNQALILVRGPILKSSLRWLIWLFNRGEDRVRIDARDRFLHRRHCLPGRGRRW
jgi:hypothetical protein